LDAEYRITPLLAAEISKARGLGRSLGVLLTIAEAAALGVVDEYGFDGGPVWEDFWC
jgi:hypothetical protein